MSTSRCHQHQRPERSFYAVRDSVELIHLHALLIISVITGLTVNTAFVSPADCCPLSLDVTSNYAYLHLMGEKRMMKPTPSPYSAQPERFTDFRQVLCKEGLTRRCYWEVEWYARSLSAAVAYKDISRTTDDSRFGNNDKSWSLECTADGYLFRHNNVETTVPGPASYKIGVFLDYQTGTLSFYQVSEQMHLLHTVHTTFTQPLHPGLGLNYEWYDVGVFAQLVKLW